MTDLDDIPDGVEIESDADVPPIREYRAIGRIMTAQPTARERAEAIADMDRYELTAALNKAERREREANERLARMRAALKNANARMADAYAEGHLDCSCGSEDAECSDSCDSVVIKDTLAIPISPGEVEAAKQIGVNR